VEEENEVLFARSNRNLSKDEGKPERENFIARSSKI